MKRIKNACFIAALACLMVLGACKKQDGTAKADDKFAVDSTKFADFFKDHPKFKDYQKDVTALYRKHDFHYVWYDEDGRNDFAQVLYDRARQIWIEGVPAELPYKEQFEDLFSDDRSNPKLEKDLLISSMYFFYVKKVFGGLDPYKSKQVGWFLPRERMSYVNYLDDLLKDEDKLQKDTEEMVGMYYNLRKGLYKYRKIRDTGGWGTITLPAGTKSLKLGDTNDAVKQLRRRLFLAGDLTSDSGSNVFDAGLVSAIKSYQVRQRLEPDGKADQALIKELNIPVESRIKTIIVNMERCRWLPSDIYKAPQYISVNIPSYSLRYVRDGKEVLQSNVVVGKVLHETAVFSGNISYLVFSPYWNIPKSIVENEINPALEKDPDYLEKHNMEWNGDQLRQRPGGENSLGLVKFMFPNSNNIYLHDTPAKSLFNKDDRAFSHGCVRVEKARDLAIKILDDDKNWDVQKVDEAMHSTEEKQYPLKKKIPVYIAYFTSIADENGNVAFFDDVYKRDAHLAHLLYKEEVSKK